MAKSSMRKKQMGGTDDDDNVNYKVWAAIFILAFFLTFGGLSIKGMVNGGKNINENEMFLYTRKDSVINFFTLFSFYAVLYAVLLYKSFDSNQTENANKTIFITSLSLLLITIFARLVYDLQISYMKDSQSSITTTSTESEQEDEQTPLAKFLTWDFNYDTGKQEQLDPASWIISLIFGFMFGFIDNYGLALGLDNLEEDVFKQYSFFKLGFNESNDQFVQGWGNTFSDLLGVTIADSIANIISIVSNKNQSNLISNALGVGLGCLVGVVVVGKKTDDVTKGGGKNSIINFENFENFKKKVFPLLLFIIYLGCYITYCVQCTITINEDEMKEDEEKMEDNEKYEVYINITSGGILLVLLFVIFYFIFWLDTSNNQSLSLIMKVIYYIIIFGYLLFFTVFHMYRGKNHKIISLLNFLNDNIDIDSGVIKKYSARDLRLSLLFGIIFGAIDNIGLFIGADSFGKLFGGDDENYQNTLGNTYSDLIGATIGTFISQIAIFRETDHTEPYQGGPIWANSISIIIGCIIPIAVVGLYKACTKTEKNTWWFSLHMLIVLFIIALPFIISYTL